MYHLAVLAEKAAEDAHAADPENLAGEASLAGTTTLTGARVATLALGLEVAVDAGARVDGIGLADDVAVLDELWGGGRRKDELQIPTPYHRIVEEQLFRFPPPQPRLLNPQAHARFRRMIYNARRSDGCERGTNNYSGRGGFRTFLKFCLELAL